MQIEEEILYFETIVSFQNAQNLTALQNLKKFTTVEATITPLKGGSANCFQDSGGIVGTDEMGVVGATAAWRGPLGTRFQGAWWTQTHNIAQRIDLTK